MTIGLRCIPLSEFTRRVAERTGQNSWMALVVPDDKIREVLEIVAFGVEGASSEPVAQLAEPASAEELVTLTRGPGVMILPIGDGWPDTEWPRLDALRSRLVRDSTTALVLSESAARSLLHGVPHFASFFGGSVWQLEPETGELSEPERVARVKALEAWAGMSSDEMMARAERKELPPEPEYAEWLVLVHRSELL